MTWRRFCVLLGGLSARSRFAAVVADRAPAADERVISDPAEVDRFVANLPV